MQFSQGQIGQMRLPKHWVEGPNSPVLNAYLWHRNFVCKKDFGFRICYLENRKALTQPAVEIFSRCLAEPPHLITGDEWKTLAEVVYPAQNPMALSLETAKTSELNGRKVLIMYGKWQRGGTKNYHILYPVGSFVHSIFFEAQVALYDEFISTALDCFATIVWKDGSD